MTVRGGYTMQNFKPVKTEKVIISIRIDANTLKTIDELSNSTDISRNEMIVQCIDYALENFNKDD
jgi:metal-responsive CopG/Arc/MetJ family transcriptional regulator